MGGHMGRGGWRGGIRSIGGGRVPVVVATVLAAGMLGFGAIAVSCGAEPRGGGSTSTRPVTTSVGDVRDDVSSSVPSSLAVTTSGLASVTSRTIAQVFAELARSKAPMYIYGLTGVKRETVMPGAWWPVLYLQAPSEYEGPLVSNPRVSGGQGGAAQKWVRWLGTPRSCMR